MAETLPQYGTSFITYDKTLPEQVFEVVSYANRSLADPAIRDALADIRDRSETDLDAAAQAALVADLFRHLARVPVIGSDREFEPIFNLLLFLLVSFVRESDFPGVVDTITSIAATPPSPGAVPPGTPLPSATCRYIALGSLFNVLSPAVPELKISVLRTLVSLAVANDNVPIIAPVLDSIPTWIREWAIPGDALVRDIAVSLLAPSFPRPAYILLLSYLEAVHQSALAADLARAALLAAPATDIPRLNKLFDRIPITDPAVHSLFSAWASANLSALHGDASNAALAANAIHLPALEKRTKLTKLALLFNKNIGAPVAYADIAAAVGIPAPADDADDAAIANVESWTIDAINQGLVTGRLSQVSLEFYVYAAQTLAFADAHWPALLDSLTQWRARLDALPANVDAAIEKPSL